LKYDAENELDKFWIFPKKVDKVKRKISPAIFLIKEGEGRGHFAILDAAANLSRKKSCNPLRLRLVLNLDGL